MIIKRDTDVAMRTVSGVSSSETAQRMETAQVTSSPPSSSHLVLVEGGTQLQTPVSHVKLEPTDDIDPHMIDDPLHTNIMQGNVLI